MMKQSGCAQKLSNFFFLQHLLDFIFTARVTGLSYVYRLTKWSGRVLGSVAWALGFSLVVCSARFL